MMVQHSDLLTRSTTSRRNKIVRQRLTHEVPTRSEQSPAVQQPAPEVAPVAEQEVEPVPMQMDLSTLMRRCAAESERFYRGQQHDTRYSYELFRRALVDRNEAAWEQLFQHYSGLVEGWVRRNGAFTSSGESSEYFVVGAFIKFWRAISPERFASFPSLASLLHYLQLCATSVVIDSVRSQSWAEMVPEDTIHQTHTAQSSPDEEAVGRVYREEFWKLIDAQLNGEMERVVVYCSFVLGLTPRAIFSKRGDLFNSVNDVYNVKRNVLGRLGRNTQLRQMFAS
jgi:DNA-directed RNA polymerase specialized sigma24 family protein